MPLVCIFVPVTQLLFALILFPLKCVPCRSFDNCFHTKIRAISLYFLPPFFLIGNFVHCKWDGGPQVSEGPRCYISPPSVSNFVAVPPVRKCYCSFRMQFKCVHLSISLYEMTPNHFHFLLLPCWCPPCTLASRCRRLCFWSTALEPLLSLRN